MSLKLVIYLKLSPSSNFPPRCTGTPISPHVSISEREITSQFHPAGKEGQRAEVTKTLSGGDKEAKETTTS